MNEYVFKFHIAYLSTGCLWEISVRLSKHWQIVKLVFFPTEYPKKRKRHSLFLEYLIIPWQTVERRIAPGTLRCPLGEGKRRDNDCITSPLFGCKHLIMLQELVLSEAKLSVNAKLIDSLLSPVWVSSRWMSESYSNVTGLHFFSCMV